MYVHIYVGMYEGMYVGKHLWLCHKGVVFQTIRSIVCAQGISLQCISNWKKTNDEAFL